TRQQCIATRHLRCELDLSIVTSHHEAYIIVTTIVILAVRRRIDIDGLETLKLYETVIGRPTSVRDTLYAMIDSGGKQKGWSAREIGKVCVYDSLPLRKKCSIYVCRSPSTKRPTLDRMFASTSQRYDDGLRASYNISLLIAKSGKPHTIGEKLILPAVEEVLKTVLHKPASHIIKRIPLSNNTDIESFLCNCLQTNHFSIQLDESTLPNIAALLLAYGRFIMNQEVYEELLFARTLITDTKDFECRFEDILTTVIPPWIINPYGDIEETNVIIQEELTELSTNEELKVQFKNGYQQFWLQNNIPVTYPDLWNIARKFLNALSIVIPSGKGVQRCYQSPNEKKKQIGHH
ncbi:unnamed protein product, partial [Acanthoscelides obtectus]